MVTASVNSDGGGLATVNFVPSLRASPADNAALTINNPKCIMQLDNDGSAAWDWDAAEFYGITFGGVEVFS